VTSDLNDRLGLSYTITAIAALQRDLAHHVLPAITTPYGGIARPNRQSVVSGEPLPQLRAVWTA
jgi:hypothetical protein